LELTPAQALVQAQQFLDDDLPFQAHEVFEAMWKQRRDAGVDDAGMWQGLAQIAVGLTHLQRRNTAGAVALLRRGAGNLDGHPAAALQSWAEQVAGAIEAGAGSPVELLAARPELR
jgi:predicted metal-dependent hydrolase